MRTEKVQVDFDGLWKDVIESFFEDFVLFFVPDLYEYVDFSKGYEFIENELTGIFPDSEEGKRRTDKVARVYLKNGEERWILVHVEVQGYKDDEFTKRMFTYFYRIYDKYEKEIFTIALFTDKNKNYKPNEYRYDFFDTKVSYSYRTYKILDQEKRLEELEQSDNPFAMVVLSAFMFLKARTIWIKSMSLSLD